MRVREADQKECLSFEEVLLSEGALRRYAPQATLTLLRTRLFSGHLLGTKRAGACGNEHACTHGRM